MAEAELLEGLCGTDMESVPTKSLERAYWRRKLPPAFRFFLEMVTRYLIDSKPDNIYGSAAIFFEELLIERDKELSLLPYESYLSKLRKRPKAKNFWGTDNTDAQGIIIIKGSPEAVPEKPTPPPLTVDQTCICARCDRCGGVIKPQPVTQPPPPPPAKDQKQAEPSEDESCIHCARCGKAMSADQDEQVAPSKNRTVPPGQAAPLQDQVEPPQEQSSDSEYHVIPINAWGKLSRRSSVTNENEIINTRSLAILVDY